jgi:hypothetical protein
MPNPFAHHAVCRSSVQGASQAVEDGLTLAITLSLAGKHNVRLGTQTWESIRYVHPKKRRVDLGITLIVQVPTGTRCADDGGEHA